MKLVARGVGGSGVWRGGLGLRRCFWRFFGYGFLYISRSGVVAFGGCCEGFRGGGEDEGKTMRDRMLI